MIALRLRPSSHALRRNAVRRAATKSPVTADGAAADRRRHQVPSKRVGAIRGNWGALRDGLGARTARRRRPGAGSAAAAGDGGPVEGYRGLLAALGATPRAVDEERLRAAHPGLDMVRLPGSGLVVTLGELNVLPDYLGRPEEIEAAPLRFIGPLIQSVRSWSVAELGRSAGHRSALPRLLPGSLRYPLLGPLAETAEIAAITSLGKRQGFAPANWYASVLARNACHFAPFSWYRWHAFHLAARDLIARSAAARGEEREALRHRARIYAGYADHFLQDSFAAGHQVNKTLVIQWYIEWLAASGVSYPHRDVLDALTVARQPLLHGPGHYDRAAARRSTRTDAGPARRPRGRGAAAALGPARRRRRGDVGGARRRQRRHRRQRRGPAGRLRGVPGHARQRHRAARREGRARVPQQALARRLLRTGRPAVPYLRRPHPARQPAGALRTAQAAEPSRRAIADLLRDGETPVDSWDIFDSFPNHVEQDGRMVSLPRMAPRRAARPVLRAVRPAVDARGAVRHVQRLPAAGHAHRGRPLGLT